MTKSKKPTKPTLIAEAVALKLIKNKTAARKISRDDLAEMIAINHARKAMDHEATEDMREVADKPPRERCSTRGIDPNYHPEQPTVLPTAQDPQGDPQEPGEVPKTSTLTVRTFSSGATSQAGTRAAQRRRRLNNRRKYKATTNRRRHNMAIPNPIAYPCRLPF